jgi:glucose-6-phosphate isomerase
MPRRAERSCLGSLAAPARAWRKKFDALGFAERLRAHDTTLWTKTPAQAAQIARRLGWVEIGSAAEAGVRPAAAGDVLLIGMGGSSLGAEAAACALGATDRLRVLDSTVPEAVRRVSAHFDDITDVVVASKSGSTVETVALADYFEELAAPTVHFHAVTDPGSTLAARAAARGYASCHLNAADIGGRFSVLSGFGGVPLSLAGVDFESVLASARQRSRGVTAGTATTSSALYLAAALAAAAEAGRDKLLIATAPEFDGLADWIEQLVAESTGKDGVGIIPVTRARIEDLAAAPPDGVLVLIEWAGTSNDELGQLAATADSAGVPVLRIELDDAVAIGGEFYTWEVAVAALGHALGVNPFDEPNVTAAKDRTRTLLEAHEREGPASSPVPTWRGDLVEIYRACDAPGQPATGNELLSAFAAGTPGGYLGVLAYLAPRRAVVASVNELRDALGGHGPVTVGWGPRYLHSSGQLHKGGPPTGRFMMLTAEAEHDLPIPGKPWTFGALAAAQAFGDLQALEAGGRTAIRVHLRGDTVAAMAELLDLIR